MAEKRDYYEVLGVDRKAGQDDIKRAYRKLAKESHPDLHPNDKTAEARFKEINEAHEVLSDPQKRATYDQYGMDGPPMGGFGGGFEAGGFGGFESIFDQLFGGAARGGQRRNAPMRGHDILFNMRVEFEEAVFGASKAFDFMRAEKCEVCGGTGAKEGTQPVTCATCKGTGQVRSGSGFMVTVRTCTTCGGTGQTIKDPCTGCSGSGRVRRKRTANFTLPPGADDGQVFVMGGKGDAGQNGGPPGDLQIAITVKPHALFKREGTTLYLEMPISITQAALGATVDIPTLKGKVSQKIPEGTQDGALLRIKGEGVQQLHGSSRGDLVVRVRVEIPKKLSEKQKELLRAFDAETTGKQYESRKGFLDKVKELFSA
ncbi:MAG TPA: molecular chaperone DnaJ [Candidatus Limnocylindria bacterium]|nr:molecular chaperone DnaJ [Candidatus Limnocylindria bacterium]